MRKVFAITVMAGLLAYLLAIASCGDFDPSKAHLDVEITFEGPDETMTVGCVTGGPCWTIGYDWRWVEVTVTETTERTGATAPVTGAPLNDVEISFMTWPVKDDQLYLVTDNRSALPPLAEPYTMRTDERGHAEIIWMFQGPAACAAGTDTHWIEASVGTDKSRQQVDITCEAATDDDSGDDSQ
jgi:hypothetical protein